MIYEIFFGIKIEALRLSFIERRPQVSRHDAGSVRLRSSPAESFSKRETSRSEWCSNNVVLGSMVY
jgi:hypothetical protein